MTLSNIDMLFKNRIIYLIFIISLLVLIRAPFLNDVLCGEEGQFAFLVASPVPSAELSHTGLPKGLMANIGGEQYLGFLSRTITPYLILENIVGSMVRPLKIMEMTDPDHRAIGIHLVFLALFLVGSLGAIWQTTSRSMITTMVVIWALSTPLAIGASIQPQLDGPLGVFLLGLSAWLMTASRTPFAILLSGLLAGSGKHEWALAFFVAGLLTIIIEWIMNKSLNKNILYFQFGLMISVGFSVIISYENYVAGIGIMQSFYGEESPLVLAKKNFRYLAPTVIILILCGLMTLGKMRKIIIDNSLLFMLYLGGSAILCGFALSGHNPDLPRYFAPPLVIFIYVFLSLQPYYLEKTIDKYLLYGLLGIGCTYNIQYLIYSFIRDYSVTTCATTMPDLKIQRKMYDDAVEQNKMGKIPVLSSGIWVYNSKAYFVEESCTKPWGDELLIKLGRQNEFEIIEPSLNAK